VAGMRLHGACSMAASTASRFNLCRVAGLCGACILCVVQPGAQISWVARQSARILHGQTAELLQLLQTYPLMTLLL